jgi:uncharacterized protein (DUF362 family)
MADENIVVKVECGDSLTDDVNRAVGELGGFKKFVNEGEVVLIKPNYNTADPFPASTSLDFLRTVIRAVYDQGAKAVIVGESSTYSLNTRETLEKAGVIDLCKREKAKVYVFEEREWVKKNLTSTKYLNSVTIPKVLDRVDKTIILPCLKTHRYARFTASLKLAVGFMKTRQRMPLHFRKLEEKIAELNKVYQPDLILMDGRKVFVTLGPEKGRVENSNLILAGTDRIAVDVEGVKILKSFRAKNKLDMPVWDLPQIKTAVDLNLGAGSEEDYVVKEI